jgi:hypothetical protein
MMALVSWLTIAAALGLSGTILYDRYNPRLNPGALAQLGRNTRAGLKVGTWLTAGLLGVTVAVIFCVVFQHLLFAIGIGVAVARLVWRT